MGRVKNDYGQTTNDFFKYSKDLGQKINMFNSNYKEILIKGPHSEVAYSWSNPVIITGTGKERLQFDLLPIVGLLHRDEDILLPPSLVPIDPCLHSSSTGISKAAMPLHYVGS